MKLKCYIIMLLGLLLMPILGSSYTAVEWSSDNATWGPAAFTMQNNLTIEILDNGITNSTLYYFRVRHVYATGNSSWTYTSIMTEAKDKMDGNLAIMLFITLPVIALFALHQRKKQFVNHPVVDLLLRRCLLILVFFLLALNSAIMMGVAESAGLTITSELTTFMWCYGMAGYLAMIYTILRTMVDIFKMQRYLLKYKRTRG